MRRKQTLSIGVAQHQPIILLERFHGGACIIHSSFEDSCKKKVVRRVSKKRVVLHNIPTKLKVVTKRTPSPVKYEGFMSGLLLSSVHRSARERNRSALPILQLDRAMPARRRSMDHQRTVLNTDKPSILSPKADKHCLILSPLTVKEQPSDRTFLSRPSTKEFADDSNSGVDDDEEQEKIDELLKYDLTSPMGVKMTPLLEKHQHFCRKISTQNYDSYCNRPPAAKSDDRALRSQTAYCDDRWSYNNIHYVRREWHHYLGHIRVVGHEARRERARTLKYGLDKRSRALARLLKPCSVVISTDRHLELLSKSQTTCGDVELEKESSSAQQSSTTIQTQKPDNHVVLTSTVNVEQLNSDCGSADKGLPSKRKERNLIRKALEPILSENPTSWRCADPLSPDNTGEPCSMTANSLQTEKKYERNRSFVWEDFAADKPKLELEVLSKPDMVDLTLEDSDNEVIFCLPSPTELLGSWHIPEPCISTKRKKIEPAWPKIKPRRRRKQLPSFTRLRSHERKKLLMQNSNLVE